MALWPNFAFLMGCQRLILLVLVLEFPSLHSALLLFLLGKRDRIAIESDPSLLWSLSGDFHAQLMFMTSDCIAAITHWKSANRRGWGNLWTLTRTRSRWSRRSIVRSNGDRLNHAWNHLNENVAARKLATVFFLLFSFFFPFAIWIYVHRRYLTCENQSLIDATTTDFPLVISPLFPTLAGYWNCNSSKCTYRVRGDFFYFFFFFWCLECVGLKAEIGLTRAGN